MRVTEDELLLAAYYGFGRRLVDVVAATLTYQRDKRSNDRLADEVRECEAVLATARRLAGRLSPGLGLVALAEAQHRLAQRELERAGDRLRTSADRLLETAGGALPDVLGAMERHHWALDRPKLVAALRERAGMDAEPLSGAA